MNIASKCMRPANALSSSQRAALRRLGLAAAVAFFLPSAAAATDHAAEPPASLTATINATNSLINHIHQLQVIADLNGGHRTAGSQGHLRSVEYFTAQLSRAGLSTRIEKFEFLYSAPVHARLTQDNEHQDIIPATFGPSTPGPLEAAPHFVVGDPCNESAYLDVPRGTIVVIEQSPQCTAVHQYQLASASAGRAVIIASQSDTPPYIWLEGAGQRDKPLVGINQPTYARIRAARSPLALDVLMITERRWSWNLIAENPGVKDAPAIEIGAHLDSVPQSPGINDNASSAALLLDHAIRNANKPNQRTIRYMFWSGEEFAFAGSRNYLLTIADPESIYAYVNLEMLTAPNSGYFYIQDHAGGHISRLIAHTIIKTYRQLGIGAEADPNTIPRSDDSSYRDAGISTGGLWGGSFEIKTEQQAESWGGDAGKPFDSCYHQPCDRTDRLDYAKLIKAKRVIDRLLQILDASHD